MAMRSQYDVIRAKRGGLLRDFLCREANDGIAIDRKACGARGGGQVLEADLSRCQEVRIRNSWPRGDHIHRRRHGNVCRHGLHDMEEIKLCVERKSEDNGGLEDTRRAIAGIKRNKQT